MAGDVVNQWLSMMMSSGATKQEMMNALSGVGYNEQQAEQFLRNANFREQPINVDPMTKNRVGFEYLEKHTVEANRASAKYNVPSEMRDIIGHAARSSAIFGQANVVMPSLRGFDPNKVHTNNPRFDEITRKINQLSGMKLPPSAIARNTRVMSALMQRLQQGKFAMGGDVFNTPRADIRQYEAMMRDATRRMQLLRNRAQAGQRLKNMRSDAQLGVQLKNSQLMRTPGQATGIINANVMRNLERIYGKFASGGQYTKEQLAALKSYISDSSEINQALMSGKSHPLANILMSMASPATSNMVAYKGLSNFWKKGLGPLKQGRTVKNISGFMSASLNPEEAIGYAQGRTDREMKTLQMRIKKGTPIITPPKNMRLDSEVILPPGSGSFKVGKSGNIGDLGNLINFNQLRNGGKLPGYFMGGLEALASPEMLMGSMSGIQGGIGLLVGAGIGGVGLEVLRDKLRERFFNQHGTGDLEPEGVTKLQKLLNLKQFQGDKLDPYGYLIQNEPFMDKNIGALSKKFSKGPSMLTNLMKRFRRASGGPIWGDFLRGAYMTKTPESASKLIGYNTVNSLQKTAEMTGMSGLLQSMIKSGASNASFRGLFYRKGLNIDEWMNKVHQMKLQDVEPGSMNYAYTGFAKGGKILGRGTSISDSIPANLSPGSYILDKDTVQALGENFLNGVTGGGSYKGLASGGMGANALISNGEWLLSPAQAKAMGGPATLDKLRSMSNDRVLSGKERSILPFANGGKLPGFADGSRFTPAGSKYRNISMKDYSSMLRDEMFGNIDPSIGFNADFAAQTIAKVISKTLNNFITPEGVAGLGRQDIFSGYLKSIREPVSTGSSFTKLASNLADVFEQIVKPSAQSRVVSALPNAPQYQSVTKFEQGIQQVTDTLSGIRPDLMQQRTVPYTPNFTLIPEWQRINPNAGNYSPMLDPTKSSVNYGEVPNAGVTMRQIGQTPDVVYRAMLQQKTGASRLDEFIKDRGYGLKNREDPITLQNRLIKSDLNGIRDILKNSGKSGEQLLNLMENPARFITVDLKRYVTAGMSQLHGRDLLDFKKVANIDETGGLTGALPEIQASLRDYANILNTPPEKVTDEQKAALTEYDRSLHIASEAHKAEANAIQSNITRINQQIKLRQLVGKNKDIEPVYRWDASDKLSVLDSARVMPYDRFEGTPPITGFGNRFGAMRNRVGSRIDEIHKAWQGIGSENIEQVTGTSTGRRDVTRLLTDKELIDPAAIERIRGEVRQEFAGITGGVESALQDFVEKQYGSRLGRGTARGMVSVTPDTVFDPQTNEILSKFNVDLKLLTQRLSEAGVSTEEMSAFVSAFSKEATKLTKTEMMFTRTPGQMATQPGRYGVWAGMSKFGKDLSWRSASLSMSSMGVYFSLMGIFMALTGAVSSLTSSLSDLNNIFKNVGYVNAFAKGARNANDILGDFGLTQKDLVTGWENVTYAQSAFSLSMASLATSIFKDKEFTNDLVGSISELFKRLSEKSVMDSFTKFLTAGAKVLPEVVDALKMVTYFLNIAAEHPALIRIATQMYGITLLLQPLTSGISLVTSGLGQMAGMVAEIKALNAAINALNIGMGGLALKSTLVLVAWEAMGQAYQVLVGQEAPWWAKPISSTISFATGTNPITGESMFAEGGLITGPSTAAIDDKTIRVDEGEFVINRKSASKLGLKTLNQLNKFQTGGATGSAIPLGNGLIGQAIQKSNDDYYRTKSLNTSSDIDDNTRRGTKVLTDSAESDGIGVYVRNWKDAGWDSQDKGGDSQWPFDLGMISRLINPNPSTMSGVQALTPSPTISPDLTPAPTVSTVPGNFTYTPTPELTPSPDDTPSPNITPTDSVVNYVSQLITPVLEGFADAVDAVRESLFGLMDAMNNAASIVSNTIGSITESIGNVSLKPVKDIVNGAAQWVKGTGIQGGTGTPTISAAPIGYRGNRMDWMSGLRQTDYEDLVYHHGGYTQLGTPTNYLEKATKRSGYMNRWNYGLDLPVGELPASMRGTGIEVPKMTEMWPGKQIWGSDFPYDYGEVGRALTSGDPYEVALSIASMKTSNAATGLVGKGLQMGSLKYAGTLGGRALSRVGAGFTQANMIGFNPAVFFGAHLAESGQAFDEWAAGRSAQDLKTGKYNAATGLLTGGFSTAGFGKGMEVWRGMANLFGNNLSEEDMRNRVKENDWLFNAGIGPGHAVAGAANLLGIGDEYTAFFDQLKGGNVAVSDEIRKLSKNVPLIGESVGGFVADMNEGVYDLMGQLANLDVGSIFGAGTATIGVGAGAVETGINLGKDLYNNPLSAASLYMTTGMAGLPVPGMSILGPYLAQLLMPQTTSALAGISDTTDTSAQLGFMDKVSGKFELTGNSLDNLNTYVIPETSKQIALLGKSASDASNQLNNNSSRTNNSDGIKGYARGGVVTGNGYDMVPNSPDDTIAALKSGEMVLTKEQQHLISTLIANGQYSRALDLLKPQLNIVGGNAPKDIQRIVSKGFSNLPSDIAKFVSNNELILNKALGGANIESEGPLTFLGKHIKTMNMESISNIYSKFNLLHNGNLVQHELMHAFTNKNIIDSYSQKTGKSIEELALQYKSSQPIIAHALETETAMKRASLIKDEPVLSGKGISLNRGKPSTFTNLNKAYGFLDETLSMIGGFYKDGMSIERHAAAMFNNNLRLDTNGMGTGPGKSITYEQSLNQAKWFQEMLGTKSTPISSNLLKFGKFGNPLLTAILMAEPVGEGSYIRNFNESNLSDNPYVKGFANGGVIGGADTSAIDDKMFRGEEGEFVVRKPISQKYKDVLTTLNNTGKLPRGFATGGSLGPSDAFDYSSFSKEEQDAITRALKELPPEAYGRILEGNKGNKIKVNPKTGLIEELATRLVTGNRQSAGGIYDRISKQINLNKDAYKSPDSLASTVLHEGTHAYNDLYLLNALKNNGVDINKIGSETPETPSGSKWMPFVGNSRNFDESLAYSMQRNYDLKQWGNIGNENYTTQDYGMGRYAFLNNELPDYAKNADYIMNQSYTKTPTTSVTANAPYINTVTSKPKTPTITANTPYINPIISKDISKIPSDIKLVFDEDSKKYLSGLSSSEQTKAIERLTNSFTNVDKNVTATASISQTPETTTSLKTLKSAVDETTKSVQSVSTAFNYAHNQIKGFDVAIKGAYNSTEAFKNYNYDHNKIGEYDHALLLGSYRTWGEGDVSTPIENRFGGESPWSLPNMDLMDNNGNPWWNQDKTGNISYLEDPNGNKYGFDMNPLDETDNKYYGAYDKDHPAPEYVDVIPEYSDINRQGQFKEIDQVLTQAAIEQQQQNTQQTTTTPQTMDVNITMDIRGDDTNTLVSRIRAELSNTLETIVRNVMKSTQPSLNKL